MIKGNYELLICSPCMLEKLTCEIYYSGELFATITQETEELLIEIYPPDNKKAWTLPLSEFQDIIETAKLHLLDKYNS